MLKQEGVRDCKVALAADVLADMCVVFCKCVRVCVCVCACVCVQCGFRCEKDKNPRLHWLSLYFVLPAHGYVGSMMTFLLCVCVRVCVCACVCSCTLRPAILCDEIKKKKRRRRRRWRRQNSALHSRYEQNKYITAAHDQTAVREKDGMSEGKRKREWKRERERARNTLIHFSWLLAAAEPAGPERERERERERGRGREREREVRRRKGVFFFFYFSIQANLHSFFFFSRCPRMFTKLHREGQTGGFFQVMPAAAPTSRFFCLL